MSRGQSIELKLLRLDDRIVPAVNMTHSIQVNQTYWTESEFISVALTATLDGGAWIVGTTHRDDRYSEWGSWDNDWAITKLSSDNRYDPAFNSGKPFLELNRGPLRGFRILGVETGTDGTLYVLGSNVNSYLPRLVTPNSHPLVVSGDFYEPMVTPPVNAPTEDLAVARFTTDGRFDATFDGDGIAYFNLDPLWEQPLGLTDSDAKFDVAADGSVVIAASRRTGWYTPWADIYALRLTPSGTPDPSFDDDGRLTIRLPESPAFDAAFESELAGVEIDSDGNVVFGGMLAVHDLHATGTSDQSYTSAYVIRMSPEGVPDHSFGEQSVTHIPIFVFGSRTQLRINHFTLDAFDRPLLTGWTYSNPPPVPSPSPPGQPLPPLPPPAIPESGSIVRLNLDGSKDETFDGDGVLKTNPRGPGTYGMGLELVPLADGGFIFKGNDNVWPYPELEPNGTPASVVVKYFADGTLDTAFVPHRTFPDSNWDSTNHIDVLSDGRMLYFVDSVKQVFAIEPGIISRTFNLPYNSSGPWQPPPGWVPFATGTPFRAAAGDFNGDGTDDFAYTIGAGFVTNIRIVNGIDGSILIHSFQPYESRFQGGMYVDAGDFDGDGKDELVVSPDSGGSARVQIFSFANSTLIQKANFFAIKDTNFRGGGSIAVADMNGDGKPDLAVGAARGGAQRIATFDGKTLLEKSSFPPVLHRDYFAPLPGTYEVTYRGGVDLRSEDTNGDGKDEFVMFANTRPSNFNVGIVVYGLSDVLLPGVSGDLLRYDVVLFDDPSIRDKYVFHLVMGFSHPI